MNYAQIRTMDISDGPGIRIALYVSGCKFHCFNCYSKDQQNFKYGKEYTQKEEQFILDKLKSSHVSGLSILGGDPLWQNDIDIKEWLIPLVIKTKQLNKTVWIWSGFTWEEIFQTDWTEYQNDITSWKIKRELISLCDVWVDGRYEDKNRNIRLPFCGSTNQRVIDIQKSLKQNKIILFSDK